MLNRFRCPTCGLFSPSPIVTGSTPLLLLMSHLSITLHSATLFHQTFERIDVDHSGSLTIEEVLDYANIEETEFARRAFNAMDFEGEDEGRGERGDGGEVTSKKKLGNSMSDRRKRRLALLLYMYIYIYFIFLFFFFSSS